MSLAGHVLWKRRLTVSALEIIGAAKAPAATAPFKRPRREDEAFFSVMEISFSQNNLNPINIMHWSTKRFLRVITRALEIFIILFTKVYKI
jgi:hypothetical protein